MCSMSAITANASLLKLSKLLKECSRGRVLSLILCLMIVHKRLLKSQIHPEYGLLSGDGKSQIVGDTSIRLIDSTPALVLCVLNQINLA